MSKEEFKKFWEMIPKANESVITIDKLYDAYLTSGSGDVPLNLIDGLAKNGIVNLARTTKKDTN